VQEFLNAAISSFDT